MDLRLLWPPANCTDIFRIFSDNLGSVKLLSFRTDHPVSPSVEHHINSSSNVRTELCILSPLLTECFLSPLSWRERADNIWPERDKDGEERPAIMETAAILQ